MSQESPNGYTLSGVLLPEEVIIHLASYADPQTLLNCRLVCRVWRELVDEHVWRHKLQREKHRYLSSDFVDTSQDLQWLVYYSICNKDPYGRNLIKNPCGEDGLKDWNIIRDGGNRLVVEANPIGCHEVPEVVGSASCFVTSFGDCSKEQWINLVEEGIPPHIMDDVRPAIHVSDWYANRFDCGAVYELKVSLRGADKKKLKEHTCLKRMMDGENMSWKKISLVFRSYPAGVRYVRFYHKGKDSKFWAGHYGAKLTGSSVKLSFLQSGTGSESETSVEDVQTRDENSDTSDEYSVHYEISEGDFSIEEYLS